jgi:hypothetical protein
VAAHPVQDEAPAERLTVSPLPDLLKKPQADMRRSTFSQLHLGQHGFSLPKTRHSKSWLQPSQWYSYMGMTISSYFQRLPKAFLVTNRIGPIKTARALYFRRIVLMIISSCVKATG